VTFPAEPSPKPRFELGTDGPKVLVVGIDGSTTSMRAGSYAAGLARRQHSQLVVVYVARPGGLADLSPGTAALARRTVDEIAADLRRQVEERASLFDMRPIFRVQTGDPFSELVKVAEEVRADGIVVGASTQAGHRFAGSIAIRLVKAGRWPVTVVP
jgi:nucleotide-binding universal stress UspA family protein